MILRPAKTIFLYVESLFRAILLFAILKRDCMQQLGFA